MRRILAAAVLGAALFAAACTDKPVDDASPSPSVEAAGTADTKAVCDAVEKAGETFAAALLARVGELSAVQADESKAQAWLASFGADYAAFSTTLKAEAAKASDAELKAALDEFAKVADAAIVALADPALMQDPSKIQEVMASPEFKAAGDKLEKICSA